MGIEYGNARFVARGFDSKDDQTIGDRIGEWEGERGGGRCHEGAGALKEGWAMPAEGVAVTGDGLVQVVLVADYRVK